MPSSNFLSAEVVLFERLLIEGAPHLGDVADAVRGGWVRLLNNTWNVSIAHFIL